MTLVGSGGRRLRLVTAGLVLFVSPLVMGPSTAVPDSPSSGLRRAAIVFTRLDDFRGEQDPEIWTMDRVGGGQRRLTFNDGGDYDPAWSPDGSQIAWVRYEDQFNVGSSDIWLMNADGTGKVQLTHDSTQINTPTWSPDGSQIAFEKNYRIWVMNADGSDAHQISPESGLLDFQPDWSPDGSKLVFVSTGEGFGPFDLWTMSPDGSNRHLVRHHRFSERNPQWSPDGTRIAYSTYSNATGWHVSLMFSNGARPHIAVHEDSLDPTFTPDSRSLIFYSCSLGGCDLHRSGLGGEHLRRLTRRPPPPASDAGPDYRPPA